ncbi:hypothetical protein Tco_0770438 [Tanacetum coccineum]|uniref:Reverse transcriptase domain-containing protein n=1 Tax=Tanacetum coccineum TaxID=301880 RepID=A0ABQ4ZF60_9ASTR
MQNQITNLTDLLTKLMNTNTASTSGSGSLPSNTVANPKSDLKAITTRSGVTYNGTQVQPPPSSLPKVVERETKVTKDTVPPTNNGSTEYVQPSVVQVETHVPIFEPVVAPVVFSRVSRYYDVNRESNPALIMTLLFYLSPTLTPFGDSDFLLEEVDAFLALKDDPTSPKVDHSYYDSEGDILLLEAFLNDDPSLPPPT